MKVVCVSDLHGHLPEIERCDLLVIGGDVCPMGPHNVPRQRKWLDGPFADWLEVVRADAGCEIVCIAGNHDSALTFGWPSRMEDLANYLQDELVEIAGAHVYGTPWTRRLPVPWWAFGLPEHSPTGPDLESVFERIPDGTDIVVSHSPPSGYGDLTLHGERVGSEALFRRLAEVRPRLVVSGHVHEDRGLRRAPWGTTLLVNASVVDAHYRGAAEPIVVSLES